MTPLLVVLAALTIFSVTQAFYWRVVARRQGAVDLLRARLRVGQDDAFGRARVQEDALAVLIMQSGIGWSKGDFTRRLVISATLGGVFGGIRAGILGAIVLGALGALGVYGYLVYMRDRRVRMVGEQMPRALELVNLALRAGQSLPRAVEVVAEELPPPLSIELKRVVEEAALGRPIEEAFAAMNRRLPGIAPLRALITGITVLGRTGGNLIEVIDRVIDFSAQQSQFQQKLRALTAENRASGLILSLIPPGFVLLTTLVSDGYMKTLFSSPGGQTAAAVAGGFWLTGVVWIRRMAQLED